MNQPPSGSESESTGRKSKANPPAPLLALQNIKSLVSGEMQNPQFLQPYLEVLDPIVLKKAVTGNPAKQLNFCDTSISKNILKTRNFEEFRAESANESDIKTPLSQEINENNIFDQITLKTGNLIKKVPGERF